MHLETSPPAYSTADDEADILPDYSCTVLLKARLMLKWERDGPDRLACNRSWQMVHAEVRGTKLQLRSDRQAIEISLQRAEVGVATDYHRRSFVLRVRAEGRQFLLAASSLQAMLQWTEKLTEATVISLPLEDRKEPAFPVNPPKRPHVYGPTIEDGLKRIWREKWAIRRNGRYWLEAESADDKDQAMSSSGCNGLDIAYKYARSLLYGSKWRIITRQEFDDMVPPSSAC